MKVSSSVLLPIQIGNLEVIHEALLHPHLVAPVILGTDFLTKQEIVIDYKNHKVIAGGMGEIWPNLPSSGAEPATQPHSKVWENSYMAVAALTDEEHQNDCAIE